MMRIEMEKGDNSLKHLLVGNGININLAGSAYTSTCILRRIQYCAGKGGYDQLFEHTIKGTEIVALLKAMTNIGNKLRLGKYDMLIENEDLKAAVDDFKKRYQVEIKYPKDIMLEDWFLVVKAYFLEYPQDKEQSAAVVSGFERMILDGIYNAGHVQNIYFELDKNTQKNLKRYLASYDDIFTLNYDNTLEFANDKPVYHLHGSYDELADTENPNTIRGFINIATGQRVVVSGMEHCFCSALLDYSGELKAKKADIHHKVLIDSETWERSIRQNEKYAEDFKRLEHTNSEAYRIMKTKLEHPELKAGIEYYHYLLDEISGEVDIVGISLNNDDHIFRRLFANPKITKINFYYHGENDRTSIYEKYRDDRIETFYVNDLWKKFGLKRSIYTCNYKISSKQIKFLLDVFNVFSGEDITEEVLRKEINSIPTFKAKKYVDLARQEMQRQENTQENIDKDLFNVNVNSINYIAVQNGILPHTLYYFLLTM